MRPTFFSLNFFFVLFCILLAIYQLFLVIYLRKYVSGRLLFALLFLYFFVSLKQLFLYPVSTTSLVTDLLLSVSYSAFSPFIP